MPSVGKGFVDTHDRAFPAPVSSKPQAFVDTHDRAHLKPAASTAKAFADTTERTVLKNSTVSKGFVDTHDYTLPNTNPDQLHYWTGTAWVRAPRYRWNGSAWVQIA